MDAKTVEIVAGVDMGIVRGVIAVVTLLVYLGIFWWAYRSGNRDRFERDGWIPFEDEPAPVAHRERGEDSV